MPTFQTDYSDSIDLVSKKHAKKVKKIARGLIKAQNDDKENYCPGGGFEMPDVKKSKNVAFSIISTENSMKMIR